LAIIVDCEDLGEEC